MNKGYKPFLNDKLAVLKMFSTFGGKKKVNNHFLLIRS